METIPVGWLNEFEIEEDPVVIHRMNSLDDLTPELLAALFEIDSPSSDQTSYERPTKQLKHTTTQESYVDQEYATKSGTGRKRASEGRAKSPCTQDHVIAERKRREKLSQQFIALSAMVPGLKKTDKASILGDCMKYIKQLQAKVNTLEEQTSKKTMESAVFVKKFHVTSDTDSSSAGGSGSDYSHEPLPEIEARVSDRNVLIKIHCEQQKGIQSQILLETEKLNLSVISSNVIAFGSSTFDITVFAQMDAEFNMTVSDLVKNLHSYVVQFTGQDQNVCSTTISDYSGPLCSRCTQVPINHGESCQKVLVPIQSKWRSEYLTSDKHNGADLTVITGAHMKNVAEEREQL